MKKIKVITAISLLVCISFLSCSKSSSGGGRGGGGTVTEENLSISIDPDPGITVATSLGAVYNFKINIKSKMPASGVKIDIACTKDADNSNVFSQSLNNSVTPINTSVSNLVAGVLCTVKITVTSVNKPGNTASLNFKVARK
jgi:hypothetical protein